jgi:glucose-6-phosphate 1-dehydrogenase
MHDISKQASQTVQVVECPPRRDARAADPCVMVIFGASGDLTSRLILPALYNLARTGLLPENFALIGLARTEQSGEDWVRELRDAVARFVRSSAAENDPDEMDETAWKCVARNLTYISGDITKPEVYARLRDAIGAADKAVGAKGNVLFYLAVADRLFGTVVDQLGKAKLTDQEEDDSGTPKFWRRVVIEKPFGHSFESARELNARILRTLQEDQIFRIDHFLGKETVQNIMALRFANGLFEPIWNRDRIDHVQITAAETIGVGKRGRFYEVTGALRDMVPNHLFTLLSMVAMEPPTGFGAAEIRNKKFDVFSAMPAVRVKSTVRGQYDGGTVQGSKVAAYRDEPNVAPDSKTETYAAIQVEVDNWRWAGVPFYLRTGKRLASRNTEIAICFKQAPHTAFRDTPVEALRPNWLVLRIQPNEGISLQFEVKRPGPAMDLAAVRMDFRYDRWFPTEANVGYETLILDVMTGDPTLFMRADMVEQAWRVVQPVLDAWKKDASQPSTYRAGSSGPDDADSLLARQGRAWRPINGDGERTSS